MKKKKYLSDIFAIWIVGLFSGFIHSFESATAKTVISVQTGRTVDVRR